ncbi:MAG: HAD family phosphatase [Lachnospiraceae bacterium]|nr:HAD family phosphatase [Lachnospiraceae bacterium]
MRAVIFDMDGVIFDSERAYIECWKPIEKEFGILDLEDTMFKCIGVNSNMTKKIFTEKYGADFPLEKYQQMASVSMRNLVDSGKLPKKKGIDELLEFLKTKRIPMAVASSTKSETVKRELKMAGILEYFDVIVGGDMVEKSKPEPDIFLEAAEQLGAQPGECTVIEDSHNGIRAAYAAGMTAIMVPDLLEPNDEMREKATCIFESLVEVRKYLLLSYKPPTD